MVGERGLDADGQLPDRHAIAFVEDDGAVALERERAGEGDPERVHEARPAVEIHGVLVRVLPPPVDANGAAAARRRHVGRLAPPERLLQRLRRGSEDQLTQAQETAACGRGVGLEDARDILTRERARPGRAGRAHERSWSRRTPPTAALYSSGTSTGAKWPPVWSTASLAPGIRAASSSE